MDRYNGFHRAITLDHKAHRDSWQIHLCNEIEVDRLELLRNQYKKRNLVPPSYTALVIKAISIAVSELSPAYPQINSFIRKILFWNSIHYFDRISAGCAIALEVEGQDRVAVGVVEEPHQKSLQEITEILGGFSSSLDVPCVKNTLGYYHKPFWIQWILHWISKNSSRVRYRHRGTFCVNTVGKFGPDYQLSLPQTSCLQFGIGTIRERVVARNGQPFVTKTFHLTVSFERRLMNGRPGALLMERVRTILNFAEFDDGFKLDQRSREA